MYSLTVLADRGLKSSSGWAVLPLKKPLGENPSSSFWWLRYSLVYGYIVLTLASIRAWRSLSLSACLPLGTLITQNYPISIFLVISAKALFLGIRIRTYLFRGHSLISSSGLLTHTFPGHWMGCGHLSSGQPPTGWPTNYSVAQTGHINSSCQGHFLEPGLGNRKNLSQLATGPGGKSFSLLVLRASRNCEQAGTVRLVKPIGRRERHATRKAWSTPETECLVPGMAWLLAAC